MKKCITIFLCSLVFCQSVFAWGQIGHRVTGAIAEHYLTYEAKAAIDHLLPDEDLAEASTYADEMRSNPSDFWQQNAHHWHYVNVHEGKEYKDVGAPVQGDAVTALSMFSEVIKSDESSYEHKQRALRFIVHIIGDLHQPFHTGTDLDKGGNDIKVNFFWEEHNLHYVWDSGLIDRQQLSYTEWTHRLNRKIKPQHVHDWSVIDPLVWIKESYDLRLGLYPKPEDGLTWKYQYKNLPIVKQRLQMSGVRIAAYLNDLFSSSSHN